MGKGIREGWGERCCKIWRLCAAMAAAVCLLGLLPAGRVRAKTLGGEITFKPLRYDKGRNEFTIEISTTKESCYVAYYAYRPSVMGSMTWEAMFDASTKTKQQSVSIAVAAGSLSLRDTAKLHAWLVDAEGQKIYGYYVGYSYDLRPAEVLRDALENFNNEIAFANGGTTLPDADVAPLDAQIQNGYLTWTPKADADSTLRVWADGGLVEEGIERFVRDGGGTEYSSGERWWGSHIDKTGTYVYFWGLIKDGILCSKANRYDYHYTRPETEMPAIPESALSWDAQKAGRLRISMSDYGRLDKLAYVELELGKEQDGKVSNWAWVSSFAPQWQTEVPDFSRYMTESGAVYRIRARALSNDIETVAHGQWTISPPYSLTTAAEIIRDSLKSALGNDFSVDDGVAAVQQKFGTAGTPEEKAALVASLTTALAGVESTRENALKVAMQTNPKVSDLIAEIEKQGGKTVTPEVPNEVKELLGGAAGSVSVVGAGLNAQANQTAALKLTKVTDAQADKWNAGGSYAKAVPIGISLTGCANADTKLQIPVRVTMTVPVGIDMAKLVILHLKADGSVAETLSRSNDGCSMDYYARTVTFTVTHFSTFVFAETAESSGSGGGDDGGSGSASQANLESLAQSAPQGAVLRLVGVTTLSNGDMKALLARKDVTVVMEYEYAGKSYRVTIPAGAAVDNDIPWYGPLYLAGRYGNGAGGIAAGISGDAYIVKRGDTLSGIAKSARVSLAQLAAKNPQIQNLDLILVGQTIRLK